ncbi:MULTISPECIES: hypothetical protein [Enterococcus]|uniref:hypothetical protein n=1 Tax=Enterococcus TaxID=1350 RepID=UPI0015F25539|nr:MULTISPECIES: hypothetical protein [Enterococcus]MBA5256207.1 hypothetical protein [Enterococcus hirae]MDB1684421.1 hypothetical protein [Enterococcus durans]
MSRFKKTHQNDRNTYKYVFERTDANGRIRKEVVEIRLGEEGVTELNIQELHRADDREIYNFYKNARPERTEAEKEKIKTWKEKFREDFNNEHGYYPLDEYVDGEANDYFKRNYNLSLNEFDDVCDEGDNPIQSLVYDAFQTNEEDPRVDRLREVVAQLSPYHQEIYHMLVTDEMSQTEVAAKLGKQKQSINRSFGIIKDKIKELF